MLSIALHLSAALSGSVLTFNMVRRGYIPREDQVPPEREWALAGPWRRQQVARRRRIRTILEADAPYTAASECRCAEHNRRGALARDPIVRKRPVFGRRHGDSFSRSDNPAMQPGLAWPAGGSWRRISGALMPKNLRSYVVLGALSSPWCAFAHHGHRGHNRRFAKIRTAGRRELTLTKSGLCPISLRRTRRCHR